MNGETVQLINQLERRISKIESQIVRPDRLVQAWMAMHSMVSMIPGLRGVWFMNQSQAGTIYDASSQARHMSINGTIVFSQPTEFFRYAVFDGSSTYLNRTSEAGLEIPNALSVMSWFYKETAATQFPMLAKTNGFAANTNTSFYFIHGTSDNLNLSITSGTTTYSGTMLAPVGEWVYGGGNYRPNTAINLYMGTQDGWGSDSNTTGIPASINTAASTDLTIGATHGGANFADGNIGFSLIANANLDEIVFRTFFEHTKALFF